MSKTIIFFGTDSFSLVSLKALVKTGYSIAAVVTKPDSKKGRGQKILMSEVKIFANEHDIEVWQPDKVTEINEKISSLPSNPIGILVSYGKIIPKSTINLFNDGIINIHPSLLPLYRGPSPIESAIENGDKETGVSIMKLSDEMDAGPVYKQLKYYLNGREDRIHLREKLAKLGAEALIEVLPDIIQKSIKPIKQNDELAVYCKLLSKSDSFISPEAMTATEAERKVRAHLGFPKTKSKIFDHDIVITKAHVSNNPETVIDIKCKDEKYLSIEELIAPSGRKMNAKDFINGYS